MYFYVLNATTWEGRRMGPVKGQGFILEPGEYNLTMNASSKHRGSGGYFNDGVYGPWQGSDHYQALQAMIPYAYYSVPGETEAQAERRNQIGADIFGAMLDAETAGRRKIALAHDDLLVRQLTLEPTWLGGTWVLEGARGILAKTPATSGPRKPWPRAKRAWPKSNATCKPPRWAAATCHSPPIRWTARPPR